MPEVPFSQLESSWRQGGATQTLDDLIAYFQQTGQYGKMFEARLMRKRHQLGLPLMPTGPLHLHGEPLKAYDAEMVEAARQTARLYLDAGNIAEAWPYFRALGDSEPIRQAIEALPESQATDAVIEIALGERVHAAKGFSMLLAQQGLCRAITIFDQYPDPATREQSLALLTAALHRELRENLHAAIERHEGAPPQAESIPALIEGRDWLFGEYSYHVDISHLMSVVRLASDSESPATLALGRELADYGARLSPELQYKGEPPFEDHFKDYGLYLAAQLGERVDEMTAHFHARVASYDYDQIGTYPAQTLVRMLLRLQRPAQAITVFEEFVGDTDPNYLSCPPLSQLCQLAGDWDRLRSLAEREQDPIRYAAALISAAS